MLRPSSRRGLTYADAVNLLGAGESRVIAALGRAAGVPAAVVGAATLSSVDLLAVRNEVVEWGQAANRKLNERLAGLGRFDRTQRLTAAHAVLVVSSFFEALGDVADEITLAEQVALGTRSAVESERRDIVSVLTEDAVPIPSAAVPVERLKAELSGYYTTLIKAAAEFLHGLAGPVPVFPPESSILDAAIRQYEIGYRTLAADVPEFKIWADMIDAAAGRAETQRMGAALGTGLAEIHSLLSGLAGAAQSRWVDLVDQYRRELARPIIDVGELPDNVRLPAVADLYVNPRARARRANPSSPIATEPWWKGEGVVEVMDIQTFLAGYLTGADATTVPLVVLGQPGSGKSMLTKVLAAALPPEEFLVVRVELRSVAADAAVQDQIEAAVYNSIGERASWPELVRSAGGALPMVLLDGFDELVQASGANRADYLEQVRQFQQRESERGRPVVVLVTTRIAVADRARMPDGSVVLRLEPFDDQQIEAWLNVWSATNAAGLADRSLKPLTVDVATRFRELAEQPLLLLMLALYDAGNNGLHSTHALGRAGLYEQLFGYFARRELGKREPSAPNDGPAIAREIHRLELVAIALFGRGAQVVSERELDDDLRVLLCDDRVDSRERDRPLSAAQLLVGRFFFLHESRAREGVDHPERSFEFLHATFGEYLVAQLVVTTLIDVAAERSHQARRSPPGPLDAGRLYAWLSFAVLAGRGPIIEFCRSVLERLAPDVRAECDALLRELLADAAFPPSTWSFSGYEPVRRSAAEREAAFTANLVTLIVLLEPSGVDVNDLPIAWREQVLFWESRLPGDAWTSFWTAMRMSFDMDGERRTLSLEDGSAVSLWRSMPWSEVPEAEQGSSYQLFHDMEVPWETPTGRWLKESSFRAESGTAAVLTHSVAPFVRLLGMPSTTGSGEPVYDDSTNGTDLEVLLELLFASRSDDDSKYLSRVYGAALDAFRENPPGQEVIVRMLERDVRSVDPDTALGLLFRAMRPEELIERRNFWTEHADGPARILATCLRHGGDPERVRAVYDEIDGDRIVNPGGQRFQDLLRREFENLGLPFPEELFA